MPEQKFDDMTWWEKVDWMRRISGYPATTIMVFTRMNLGFRMVKPTWFLMLAVALIIIGTLFPRAADPYGWCIPVYAVALVLTGALLRWKRWKEVCNGLRWHSYSPGICYLEMLPFWPPFMQRSRRINRFVEPVVIYIIALLVTIFGCRLLGTWLALAGAFVFIYEQDMFEKSVNNALDALDGLLDSEVQAEIVDHFSQAQPDTRQRQLSETAGIPTGLAPDIHRQVELRRAKRRAVFDKLEKADISIPA